MGHKYEVHAFMRQQHGGYADEQVYSGQSLIGAIRAMLRAKRVSGCVRLEWR
jgi:hypothetical protein